MARPNHLLTKRKPDNPPKNSLQKPVQIDGLFLVSKKHLPGDLNLTTVELGLAWVEKYQNEVRPQWCFNLSESALFLGEDGKPLPAWLISKRMTRYIEGAGIDKSGSTHVFRHTMATLMLENGADIRYIQQMLGHALLTTTQIYTQVSIQKLKDIHSATHPAKVGNTVLDELKAEAEDWDY